MENGASNQKDRILETMTTTDNSPLKEKKVSNYIHVYVCTYCAYIESFILKAIWKELKQQHAE